jgi:hypothetical protein
MDLIYDPDGLFSSALEWFVKLIASLGIMTLGYLGLWILAKFEVATSALSRTAKCCKPTDKHDHHSTGRQCMRIVLSFEGFARVLLLILRCLVLLGTTMLVMYIFGMNVSAWIVFPTFFVLLGIGVQDPFREYFCGISNAFESTSLQNQSITVEATYGRTMVGKICRMTATRIVMRDKNGDMLLVPHTMFAQSIIRVAKDSDYSMTHDLH